MPRLAAAHPADQSLRIEGELSDLSRSPAPWRQRMRCVLVLLLFAAVVRLATLLAVHSITRGAEINDDFVTYQRMTQHPLILITADFEKQWEGGIYAPLVPMHLWFPGGLLSRWIGPELGRRLGMLAYDLVALAIALSVAFRVAGPPRGVLRWAPRRC